VTNLVFYSLIIFITRDELNYFSMKETLLSVSSIDKIDAILTNFYF